MEKYINPENQVLEELVNDIQKEYGKELKMSLINALEDSFNDFELTSLTKYYKSDESINDWIETFTIENKVAIKYDGLSEGEVSSTYTLYGDENRYSIYEEFNLYSDKDESFEPEPLSVFQNSTHPSLNYDDFAVVVVEKLVFKDGKYKREYGLHVYIPVGAVEEEGDDIYG